MISLIFSPAASDHSMVWGLLAKLASLGIAALSLAVLFLLYQWLADPLVQVPGPFLARFTRLWEYQKLCEKRFSKINIDLHKRYGSSDIWRRGGLLSMT